MASFTNNITPANCALEQEIALIIKTAERPSRVFSVANTLQQAVTKRTDLGYTALDANSVDQHAVRLRRYASTQIIATVTGNEHAAAGKKIPTGELVGI